MSLGRIGVKIVGLVAKHAQSISKPPSSLCNANPESMVISAAVHSTRAKERAHISLAYACFHLQRRPPRRSILYRADLLVNRPKCFSVLPVWPVITQEE